MRSGLEEDKNWTPLSFPILLVLKTVFFFTSLLFVAVLCKIWSGFSYQVEERGASGKDACSEANQAVTSDILRRQMVVGKRLHVQDQVTTRLRRCNEV